jgi:hypothetical protein
VTSRARWIGFVAAASRDLVRRRSGVRPGHWGKLCHDRASLTASAQGVQAGQQRQLGEEHFATDFAADIPKEKAAFMAMSQVPISTDSFTHKVVNPAWKNKPAWYMVGRPRPVDQSGPGAHDGEACQSQDDRSECEPCRLHLSSEGDGEAHRRRRHLYARPSIGCELNKCLCMPAG